MKIQRSPFLACLLLVLAVPAAAEELERVRAEIQVTEALVGRLTVETQEEDSELAKKKLAHEAAGHPRILLERHRANVASLDRRLAAAELARSKAETRAGWHDSGLSGFAASVVLWLTLKKERRWHAKDLDATKSALQKAKAERAAADVAFQKRLVGGIDVAPLRPSDWAEYRLGRPEAVFAPSLEALERMAAEGELEQTQFEGKMAELHSQRRQCEQRRKDAEARLRELRIKERGLLLEPASDVPPPPSAQPKADITWTIVDAQGHGKPEGRPEIDLCKWKFKVRFHVRNKVGINLWLTSMTREPVSIQNPHHDRKFNLAILGDRPGWTKTTPWQYLAVSKRRDGYAGRYAAIFKGRDENGHVHEFIVSWNSPGRPPLPERKVEGEINILSPKPEETAAGRSFDSRTNSLFVILRIPSIPSTMSPGKHYVLLKDRDGRTFTLWAQVRPGQKSVDFMGSIPCLLGPFELTIWLPDVQSIPKARLGGVRNIRPDKVLRYQKHFRRRQKDLREGRTQIQNGRPVWNCVHALSALMHITSDMLRYDLVLEYGAELMRLRRENLPPTDQLEGPADHGSYLAYMAEAAYMLGDAPAFERFAKEQIRALADDAKWLEAHGKPSGDLKQKIGRVHLELADRLLILGRKPRAAIEIGKLGLGWIQSGGGEISERTIDGARTHNIHEVLLRD